MPFSQLPEKPKYESNFKKTEFIKLTKGTNVIRILDDDYVTHLSHYVPAVKTSIKCLGKEECPICQHNRKIIVENPDTFRNIQGYFPVQRRHYVNVLDRTVVKICPKCLKEVKAYDDKFPSTCSCGNFITTVEATPLNKVRVLSKGDELFDKFLFFQKKYGDLTSFDIELNAHDKDDKKTPDALPIREQNDIVETKAEDKFDLHKAILVLDVDEINTALRGVALKDILKARGADKLETESAGLSIDVSSQIADIFPQ